MYGEAATGHGTSAATGHRMSAATGHVQLHLIIRIISRAVMSLRLLINILSLGARGSILRDA